MPGDSNFYVLRCKCLSYKKVRIIYCPHTGKYVRKNPYSGRFCAMRILKYKDKSRHETDENNELSLGKVTEWKTELIKEIREYIFTVCTEKHQHSHNYFMKSLNLQFLYSVHCVLYSKIKAFF